MFGYVRACKPELRVKEFDMYKAVYCSLCKRLGKSYGIFARLTLSYDFTFLALLDLSLRDGFCGIERKRCAFNPLKKCNYCKDLQTGFDFSAAAAMIMLYYKLEDNIHDEKGIKRLGFRIIKPMYSSARKKAAAAYPEIDRIFSGYISAQTRLESAGVTDVDRVADPTAAALSALFSLCGGTESQRRVLSRLGYCMGRYIYIIDAAADYEQDKKKGAYNPFGNVSREEMLSSAQRHINLSVGEVQKAFELLEIFKFRDILANVIYLGLEETAKSVLKTDIKGAD